MEFPLKNTAESKQRMWLFICHAKHDAKLLYALDACAQVRARILLSLEFGTV